jgi:hypothetical protein
LPTPLLPTPAPQPTLAGPLFTPHPPTPSVPLSTPRPTPTIDPLTGRLIADLETWCDAQPRSAGQITAPIGLLVALADGRSAGEFATAVGRAGRCQTAVRASGAGEDELVVMSILSAGAVLWVDRGWWRISGQPIHYPELVAQQRLGGAREIFIGTGGGGSGGSFGVIGLRLEADRATRILETRPGASHMSARVVGDDHVLVTGRKLPRRPFAWDSNCCLPGGYEWLWARGEGVFSLVAERQAQSPYYVLSAFAGALQAGSRDQMADIASEKAIASAEALLGAAPVRVGPSPTEPTFWQAVSDELLAWPAIPASSRLEPSIKRLEVLLPLEEGNASVLKVVLLRGPSGWSVSELGRP